MRPRDIASAWIKHRPWHWSKDRDSPPRAAAKRDQIDEQWSGPLEETMDWMERQHAERMKRMP